MTVELAKHIQDIIIARSDMGQNLVNLQLEGDYAQLTWDGLYSNYFSERYRETNEGLNCQWCPHNDYMPTEQEFEEHMKIINEYGTT